MQGIAKFLRITHWEEACVLSCAGSLTASSNGCSQVERLCWHQEQNRRLAWVCAQHLCAPPESCVRSSSSIYRNERDSPLSLAEINLVFNLRYLLWAYGSAV